MARLLTLLIMSCLLAGNIHSQTVLDTLLFDDFDDNSKNWKLFSDEKGILEIEDGSMRQVVRQRKSRYKLNWRTFKGMQGDSVVFGFDMKVDTTQACGIAFNFIRDKKGRLMRYIGMVVDRKSVFCYTYSYRDNEFSFNWRKKMPELDRTNLHFRMEINKSKGRFFLNGEEVGSTIVGKSDSFEEWGWVVKGYTDLKIDNMYILGKR